MGRKFTIFALFYFVFEGKFQVQAHRGAYIRRGDLTEGFLRYDFGGLIFGIFRYAISGVNVLLNLSNDQSQKHIALRYTCFCYSL